MTDAQPFPSAQDAWFWTVAALDARHKGKGGPASTPRPCDPDDVIRALDVLYRRGAVSTAHARVLRWHGERAVAPLTGSADERLWNEAMTALDPALRAKGIVA